MVDYFRKTLIGIKRLQGIICKNLETIGTYIINNKECDEQQKRAKNIRRSNYAQVF